MNQVKKPADKMTHTQFFLACEALKKHRQVFTDARPSIPRAAQMLTEIAKFKVTPSSMRTIKEATGVEWKSRQEPSEDGRFSSFNAIQTLTVAVALLYKKLGETPTDGLQTLLDRK